MNLFGIGKKKQELPVKKDNLHDCIPHRYITEHNLPEGTTYYNLCERYTHTYNFNVVGYSSSNKYSIDGFSHSVADFYVNGQVLAAACATYPISDFEYRVKSTKHVAEPVVTLCNKMLNNPELFTFIDDYTGVFYKDRLVLVYRNGGYNTPNKALNTPEEILVGNVVGKLKDYVNQQRKLSERDKLKDILNG